MLLATGIAGCMNPSSVQVSMDMPRGRTAVERNVLDSFHNVARMNVEAGGPTSRLVSNRSLFRRLAGLISARLASDLSQVYGPSAENGRRNYLIITEDGTHYFAHVIRVGHIYRNISYQTLPGLRYIFLKSNLELEDVGIY